MSFYAVKNGRNPGIYRTWDECKEQVHGYSGPMYKKFPTLEEAESYIGTQEFLRSENYGSEEEIMDQLKDDEMIVYVDGSNLSDGSLFSWGIVTFSKKFGKVNLSGQSSDEKLIQYRNVAGELYASVESVRFAINNNFKKIVIHHDYTGIRHWALGEWKANNPLSQSYQDFYAGIEDVIEVGFVKVEGHTGDKFNEEADILAKEALTL